MWRDMAVFKPEHHRLVLCCRDMSLDVIEGHKERRNQYIVDMYTGVSWGRLGGGKYTKWSSLPPAGMMLSPLRERPRPDKHIVICSKISQYHGPRLGRVHADSNQILWQLFSDQLNDWISLPISYIEGWLPLP